MDWNGDDDLVSKYISSLRNYTCFSVRFNSSEQDVSRAENSLLMIHRKRTKIEISLISYFSLFLDAPASLDFKLSVSESYFFQISDTIKKIKVIDDNQ